MIDIYENCNDFILQLLMLRSVVNFYMSLNVRRILIVISAV